MPPTEATITIHSPSGEPSELQSTFNDESIKRERAQEDYRRLIENIHHLADMTQKRGWDWMHDQLQNKRKTAEILILSEEKTRDMIRHQETIKVIQGIYSIIKDRVEELNNYPVKFPLFAIDFRSRAKFDEKSGIVTIWQD